MWDSHSHDTGSNPVRGIKTFSLLIKIKIFKNLIFRDSIYLNLKKLIYLHEEFF